MAFLRRIAIRVSRSGGWTSVMQAPLEPAAHPLLEATEQLGRHVAGDDDLLVGVVQRVEGVEELLLRLHLAG
jgi:hypothetical protein